MVRSKGKRWRRRWGTKGLQGRYIVPVPILYVPMPILPFVETSPGSFQGLAVKDKCNIGSGADNVGIGTEELQIRWLAEHVWNGRPQRVIVP